MVDNDKGMVTKMGSLERDELQLIIDAKLSWWVDRVESLDIDIDGVEVSKVVLVACKACYLEKMRVVSAETLEKFCKRHCPVYRLHKLFKERGEKAKVICFDDEEGLKK